VTAHHADVTTDKLEALLSRVVDIVRRPLADHVAVLQPGPYRPILVLDVSSPRLDLQWAMTDVLRALALGPAGTEYGRRLAVPRLRRAQLT
jgi:hypothetical protein